MPPEVTLLGFCGAPWTVATYMIAGHGTPDQAPARLFAYRDPDAFAALIDLLVDASANYLVGQFEAGVDAVQIFDTWAGVLPPEEFRALVRRRRRNGSSRRCAARYRTRRSSAFRAAPATMLGALCRRGPVECGQARLDGRSGFARERIQTQVPVQGNLDPLALLAGGDALDRAVDAMLAQLSRVARSSSISATASCRDTPIAHVERMLKRVRGS